MTRRREDAIAAAGTVFLRFGYRKTSKDEVARAAGVSRQALYLWFANKRALFLAAIEHVMAKHDRKTYHVEHGGRDSHAAALRMRGARAARLPDRVQSRQTSCSRG